MSRTRLKKPKPITPYRIRGEPNRKMTHWKTENEMRRYSEE